MPPPYRRHVFVCTHEHPGDSPRGCCKLRGSEDVLSAFKKTLKERGLSATIRANASGCLDSCAFGPTVVVYPEGVWYARVSPEDVPEIIESHLVGGKPVERLLLERARSGG